MERETAHLKIDSSIDKDEEQLTRMLEFVVKTLSTAKMLLLLQSEIAFALAMISTNDKSYIASS